MPARTLIVVLNWNSGDVTAECVRSLLAMHAEAFEILVIDNGSRDGSAEYLRQLFPQIRVVANGRNLGFAAGCNVGIRDALESGFDYVLLVNNDTVVDPNLLREMLSEAEGKSDVAMVSPKIYYFDPPDKLWWAGGKYNPWLGVPRHVGWKRRDDGSYDQPRTLQWATGCVLLLRVSALRQVGFFDEQIFGNGEDLDLSLRMRKSGWRIRYIPTARLWHKEGYDYRKNVGEHVRKFTATRNLLWVMHKHGNGARWATFWPYFAMRYVAVIALRSFVQGDFRSAWSLFQGIVAFWQMLLKPGSSPLPPELVATTKPALPDCEGAYIAHRD